jgi:hypothetical protein
MINHHIKPLGVEYNESKIVSKDFFEILMSKNPESNKNRYQEAFDRAERILADEPHKTKESVQWFTSCFAL